MITDDARQEAHNLANRYKQHCDDYWNDLVDELELEFPELTSDEAVQLINEGL